MRSTSTMSIGVRCFDFYILFSSSSSSCFIFVLRSTDRFWTMHDEILMNVFTLQHFNLCMCLCACVLQSTELNKYTQKNFFSFLFALKIDYHWEFAKFSYIFYLRGLKDWGYIWNQSKLVFILFLVIRKFLMLKI